MPLTLRRQIFNAVVTVLSGINGQTPFESTVDSVLGIDVAISDSLTDDVVLGVFVRSDDTAATNTRLFHGIDANAVLSLGIRGIVRSGVDEAPLRKEELISDVKRALFAQINLGFNPNNNAVRVSRLTFEQEGIIPDGTNGSFSQFLATATVEFLTDVANP